MTSYGVSLCFSGGRAGGRAGVGDRSRTGGRDGVEKVEELEVEMG